MIKDITVSVLDCVHLEGGFATADDLARLARAIRPRDFSTSEYAQAVTECIARGWVKVLTPEDCLADAARWRDQPHQDMEPYREGSIDFTEAGWDVYAQAYQAEQGIGIEGLLSQGIQCLWDTPGRVSLIAASEEVLLREVADVKSGSGEICGDSLRERHSIVEIIGPYPIGPWWANRVYQSRQGFRADITYKEASA